MEFTKDMIVILKIVGLDLDDIEELDNNIDYNEKEKFEHFKALYKQYEIKAWDILEEMSNLTEDNFDSYDDISFEFDDDEIEEYIHFEKWYSGGNTDGRSIPVRYLYLKNWKDEFLKEIEEKNKNQEQEAESQLLKQIILDNHERELYERLKEKYEK